MYFQPCHTRFRCSLFMVLLLLLAGWTPVWGQILKDTIREHEVKGRRETMVSGDDKLNRFAPGQKVLSIDSVPKQLYEQENVAQLLSRQMPVFVKSYGFNALSTLNFRGASSAQSQVYWNGVPLQNAAMGIADISLLPVSFSDRINVVYGSSAALWGSGNVGGALLLENDAPAFGPAPRYTLSAGWGTGSFGQYNALLKAGFSNGRFAAGIRSIYQSGENNFPYTYDDSSHRMRHSRLRGAGVMGNMAWKATERDVLSMSLWWQQYDREIPPALFESASQKQQQDGSFRALLDWNHRRAKSNWYARGAYLQDRMFYDDPAVMLHSGNITRQYFQELGWKYTRHNNYLQVFAPLHLSWYRSDAGVLRQQTKAALALAISHSLFRDRVRIAFNLRDEQLNSRNELLPGLNAGWQLRPWLRLRGNVQRTFRAPTLNELYYEPGGNDQLKPETGWTQELGYGVHLKKGNWELQHDASFFNRSVHNWILWYGGAIWTPHNIATVRSRGIETENRLTFRRSGWLLQATVNTAYVLATTVKSDAPNDGSIGRQIPYTPRYQVQGSLGIGFKGAMLYYDHQYTGYRFVTADESQYLEPYQTGNLSFRYSAVFQRRPFRMTLRCNNLFDKRYEVVAFRPMPGRYWQLGISADILP